MTDENDEARKGRARSKLDVRAMADELRRVVGPEAGEIMKSTAEELIQQGARQEGREILTLQLEERFGKLDAAALKRLESASPDDLRTWAKRVLTATRLEDVFTTKRRPGSGRSKKK